MIVNMNSRHPPLQEKIFGLSIFLFAQNLWYAATKNDDLESNLTLRFGVDYLNITHLR